MPRRFPPRPSSVRPGRPRHRGAAFGLLLVVLALPGAARAAGLPGSLLGALPDSSARVHAGAAEGLDSLDVPAAADAGHITVEELVRRLAGGNVALTGMDGIVHPFDLTGAGRGRAVLEVDDLPAGGGVIHWDNYAWVPIRGITSFAAARVPGIETDAGSGGAGGVLRLTTVTPGRIPASTVAITGGSYGHRLAELDFSRTFGKYGFHADVADFSHEGFGAFGETKRSRGFGELTFPFAGFRVALSTAIATGKASSPGLTGGDLQKTAEHRYALTLERGSDRRVTRVSLLRHASRLEAGGFSAAVPFTLDDGRWRAAFRHERPAGSSLWRLDLSGGRETRSGVLPDGNTFWNAAGTLSLERPLAGSWRWDARLGVVDQEPTGAAVEPGLRVSRDGSAARWWFEAGRRTGIPALLLNQGAAEPDGNGIVALIRGLEALDRPESHWLFGAGAAASSRRAGIGLSAGAARTSDSPGYLSPSGGALAFQPVDEPYWSGHVETAASWAPRADFDLSLRAAWQAFDRDRHPFQPNLTGEGSITIHRDFFDHDLHLSAAAGGRLIGERTDGRGVTYPTVLNGVLTLTGRIRALTLFMRIENLGDLFIESDLLEDDLPVALPGMHNRIGATLRLVD